MDTSTEVSEKNEQSIAAAGVAQCKLSDNESPADESHKQAEEAQVVEKNTDIASSMTLTQSQVQETQVVTVDNDPNDSESTTPHNTVVRNGTSSTGALRKIDRTATTAEEDKEMQKFLKSHSHSLRNSKKQLSLPELENVFREENKRITDEVHVEVEQHRKHLLPIRERLRHKHEQEREEINNLFEKYDENNSGRLEIGQLRNLLRDLSGQDLDDQLVMRLLYKADPEGYYHLGDPNGVPSCGIGHLLDAITSYKAYLKDKERIDNIYDAYDWNHSGKLERLQVAALMKDMNGGKKASDDDVEWIVTECDKNHSGGIDKCELLGAVALWAEMMQERKQGERKNSAMCTVS